MKWQPIETAPKDGTHVLTFVREMPNPICVGWYQEDNDDGEIVGTWRDDGGSPTHWMPLPEPPEDETLEGQA